MNTKTMLATAAAAILLVGGIVGFAAGRSTDDRDDDIHRGDMPASMMGERMGQGPAWDGGMMEMGGMPGVRYEGGMMAMEARAFVAMMIPHHQMALDMAAIVQDRGSDPEVKALAGEVVSAQTREIAQMREWYRDWYGTEPPEMPMSNSTHMMGMSMDLGELRSTDEPDRVFLRMMIPHHASAILMADMALAGSPRAEVANLAREIVAAQSAEIGSMQRMRERIAPPLG